MLRPCPGRGRAGRSPVPAGQAKDGHAVALKDFLRISALSRRDLNLLLDLSEPGLQRGHASVEIHESGTIRQPSRGPAAAVLGPMPARIEVVDLRLGGSSRSTFPGANCRTPVWF